VIQGARKQLEDYITLQATPSAILTTSGQVSESLIVVVVVTVVVLTMRALSLSKLDRALLILIALALLRINVVNDNNDIDDTSNCFLV
jgi:hypothetical protein